MLSAKYLFNLLVVAMFAVFIATPAMAYAKTKPGVPERELMSKPDRKLSPYTGWTREHWIEVAGRIAAGFVRYMDPQTGMPTGLQELQPPLPGVSPLQYPDEELFEAFERSMTVVAAYTAATGKSTFPGFEDDLVQPYITGLIRGTDPDDPAYWQVMSDHSIFGNAIIISLLTSPRFFWDPLTGEQKQNLARWLFKLTERKAWDNNHWYFHMTPAPFLDQTGLDYDRPRLDSFYQRLLGFYRGGGWYVDGNNQGFDYYNNWGFHLFNPLLIVADSRWRESFGDEAGEHLRLFQENMPYFFGADGAPAAWGRSLSYRFASLAPLGWAVRSGNGALDPGKMRRMASGCLKYFWENGCLSDKGLLEPGFLGANNAVGETYIRRGSPYWAGTGFSCLMLPAEDPFWTTVEKPLPVETGGGVQVIADAQLVVRVDPLQGDSRVYKIGDNFNHRGRWQRVAKYFGHAYSSSIGFVITGEGGPELVAGTSAASADGKSWSFRSNPRALKVSEYENVSAYLLDEKITGSSGEVFTRTFIGRHGEVHVIYHTSREPLYLSVGGYGIQVADGEEAAAVRTEEKITVTVGPKRSIIRILGGAKGQLELREAKPHPGFEHSHLFGGSGAYPVWTSRGPVDGYEPVVLYVNAARGPLPPERASAEFTVSDQFVLRFGDRTDYLTVKANWGGR